MEILHPLRLRYFSPGELLRLFCFEDVGRDSSFRWPDGLSMKTKYRLIGNSVNVLVVTTLIECLCQSGYVRGRVTECAGRGKDDERARFCPSSTYHHHRPLFTGVGLLSLAHNFVNFQRHSQIDLLCEQRIHASTLFGFKTGAACYSPKQNI